jgi:hypothetical protein
LPHPSFWRILNNGCLRRAKPMKFSIVNTHTRSLPMLMTYDLICMLYGNTINFLVHKRMSIIILLWIKNQKPKIWSMFGLWHKWMFYICISFHYISIL